MKRKKTIRVKQKWVVILYAADTDDDDDVIGRRDAPRQLTPRQFTATISGGRHNIHTYR